MMLNKNQKIVCWVALGIIVFMGLFPPWISAYHVTNPKTHWPGFIEEDAAGYHFIFVPPTKIGNVDEAGNWTTYSFHLDYGRLFLQWILIVAVSGALLFLFREPQKKP